MSSATQRPPRLSSDTDKGEQKKAPEDGEEREKTHPGARERHGKPSYVITTLNRW